MLFHPKSFAILALSNEKLNHFQSKMRWDIDSRLDMAHEHKLLFPPDLNVRKFDISENHLPSFGFSVGSSSLKKKVPQKWDFYLNATA